MSLQTLISVAPPPQVPVYAGNERLWESVEDEIGTPLPDDFKRLVNLYGCGSFGDFVWPLSPFFDRDQVPPSTRLQNGPKMMKLFTSTQQESPGLLPDLPAYPASGGLLPWGQDSTGGLLCWQTNGPPNGWETVVLDSDWTEEYYRYALSSVDFLVLWLSGGLDISYYPQTPFPEPVFSAYSARPRTRSNG